MDYKKHSAPDNTISSVTDNKKAYNWLISIAVNAAYTGCSVVSDRSRLRN